MLSAKPLGRALLTLSIADRRKISFIVVIQIAVSLLDVVGVGLFGVVGALAISGIESRSSGNRVSQVLRVFHLSNFSFQSQVAVIGLAAVAVLVTRTCLSVFFNRRILYFFARRSALLSTVLVKKLLTQNLLRVQERTTQQTQYALTAGVTSVMMGMLANFVTLISDVAILIILGATLMFVDPAIALSTIVLFGGIALAMHRLLNVKAQELGRRESVLGIKTNAKIIEVLTSYRESVVRNRRDYYAHQISDLRLEMSQIQAETTFLPSVSKYILETTVVVGSLIVSGIQFATQDAKHAIAMLALFMAASSRIAPAVLRVQQGTIFIRGNVGPGTTTLDLIDSLREAQIPPELDESQFEFEYPGFEPEVVMTGISLTYPGKTEAALKDINLRIEPGTVVAFVGPSGAGKTSIIDTLLGVLQPDSGSVRISGLSPQEAISKWPGSISYVPQDIYIADGTVKENIGLGYPELKLTDELIMRAVSMSHLSSVIAELPLGVDTEVGERGTQLSGGQRQRLGIARALFTLPKLLVLDEATSALDGETELRVSEAIQGLRGSTTVVLIAHRLSTVRHADVVYYLENGEITASGTFDEVRTSVPHFDQQAKLLGL